MNSHTKSGWERPDVQNTQGKRFSAELNLTVTLPLKAQT